MPLTSSTGDPYYIPLETIPSTGPIIGNVTFPAVINIPSSTFTYANPTGYSSSGVFVYPNPISTIPPKLVEDLIKFVTTYLKNKCLIFDNFYEKTCKVVNKIEALKFVWFHFIHRGVSSTAIRDHRALSYSDEEWYLYFKPVESADEVLESFNFTAEDIHKALSI